MAARPHRPALGITLIVGMAACFAGMDTPIRAFNGQLPVLLVSPVDAVAVLAVLAAATPAQWGLMLLIGACGTFGHWMLTLALGIAPTSTLTPFVFTQIGLGALLGWLVFSHLPDPWGWVGMAVITVCGAASAWLNMRAAAQAKRPDLVVSADTLGN